MNHPLEIMGVYFLRKNMWHTYELFIFLINDLMNEWNKGWFIIRANFKRPGWLLQWDVQGNNWLLSSSSVILVIEDNEHEHKKHSFQFYIFQRLIWGNLKFALIMNHPLLPLTLWLSPRFKGENWQELHDTLNFSIIHFLLVIW